MPLNSPSLKLENPLRQDGGRKGGYHGNIRIIGGYQGD